MCLAVYVASDVPLPAIGWRQHEPAFWFSEDAPGVAAVRRHLGRPHVYYAGTHSGCGCGFLADGVPPGSPEHAQMRAAYEGLVRHLERYAAGPVEIWVCWGGDEASPPERTVRLPLQALRSESFAFEERVLIAVDPLA